MSETRTVQKYKAKPFYLNPVTMVRSEKRQSANDLYFASRWEYSVYQALLTQFDYRFIRRQYKVEIKPRTYTYPAMFWCADFAIISQSDELLALIEAKGLVTDEFKVRMKFLEYLHPDYWKKVIVVKNGDDAQPIDCSRKRTCNLVTLKDAIDKIVPIMR